MLICMDILNLARMTKILNFSHFEHNSPLSPSWSLPSANSKLNAEAFSTTGTPDNSTRQRVFEKIRHGERPSKFATNNKCKDTFRCPTGRWLQATGYRQLYTPSK